MGKPLSTIVEELNNVLTVVAMCTDELEAFGVQREPMADLRDAVRRAGELTRLLGELGGRDRGSDPSLACVSDVHAAHPTTVLVIDDDDDARRALVGAMDGRGWRILDASTIDDAFQRLEVVRAIDVLVIDTATRSRRFASQLVDRYPTAAVVYTGGYTDDAPLRDELPKTDVSLVCRPFAARALVERVRESVARRR